MSEIEVSGSVAGAPRLQDALETVRGLLESEVLPLERALLKKLATRPGPLPELDESGKLTAVVWEARREVQRRSADAGIYAMHLPEELGGRGFSREEMFYIEETVYRHGTLLAPAVLAWTEGPSPMLNWATEDQRERFVGPLVRGEITAAFASTESLAGSDVLSMKTNAVRDGDGWILNGHKKWITNTQYCDLVQVSAVTDSGGGSKSLSMFFVEVNRPGVKRGPTLPTMMDDGLTGELTFDSVRVPDENRLGAVGDGLALAMTWINWRRLCRGGMAAGWSASLIERAIAYAKDRPALGASLSQIQSVQHMLADMYADYYSARATSINAQRELDVLDPFAIPLSGKAKQLISTVKLVNDEALYRIADRAVQVHGANGLAKGSFEEKVFRVARNLRIPAGTVEIQRNQIAQQLLRTGLAAAG